MKTRNSICKKCGEDFIYEWQDEYWDENGSESTKLVNCPYCKTPVVIGYWSSHKWEDVNQDPRFYNYKKIKVCSC